MRFGILCNGFDFQLWQAESISELIRHGHVPVVMITGSDQLQPAGFLARWKGKNRNTLLFSVTENRIFHPEARKRMSMKAELSGVPVMSCKVLKERYYTTFSDEDCDRISDLSLGFILRFAFQILRGRILTAAKYGIWSFHHGDELLYRGGPAGFWEIFHNDTVNGAILQQLTDRLDGGIILKKGYLKTQLHSWKQNLEQLYSVTATWPSLVAGEITFYEESGKQVPFQRSAGKGKLYHVPGNGDMLRFIIRLLRNRLKFIVQKYFFTEKWNIGIVDCTVQELVMDRTQVSDDQVTWFPELPGNHYLADPFAVESEGQLVIFAEHFHYDSMQGDICRIGQGSHHSELKFPGQPAVHRSYPYVVQAGEELFCMPESWQSGEIALFRFNAGFSGFIEKKVILRDVEAVDPTLFFHEQRWWLFFTQRNWSNTHLFLWYSEKPEGPYSPHRLNPVKIDIRSARPAGNLFYYQGCLYRPGQDCSKTYGGRIAVNRILHMSPDTYSEETVKFLEPDRNSRYNEALHTISGTGSQTLIDGKRCMLNWKHAFNQAKKRITNDKSIGWSK